MLRPTSEVSKRCQKYASSVHISRTVNIVHVGSEQNHYLDSRECRARRATYSCLGNINHFILATDFSYCENPFCSEVSSRRKVGGLFNDFSHAKKKNK